MDVIFNCQGIENFLSDLNLALKFLLCLDIVTNPFFRTGLSISDSLEAVRKSDLIYETIIIGLVLYF